MEGEFGEKKMGFAAMTREKQREIARQGGKALQASGRAHKFTSEEAREAGKKGGPIASQNRDRMREIGAKGGRVRAENARQRKLAEEEKAGGEE